MGLSLKSKKQEGRGFSAILASQKGVTLIEFMISFSILAFIAVQVNFIFSNLRRSEIESDSKYVLDLSTIHTNLRVNISQYQIYNTKATIDALTKENPTLTELQVMYDLFKWAVDSDGVVPLDQCGTCAKRLGIVIHKFSQQVGSDTRVYDKVYQVTLRGVEKIASTNPVQYKEFYHYTTYIGTQ